MTDEKQEAPPTEEASAKAHFDEAMARIAEQRKEWGPGASQFTTSEEALESACEYEISALCRELAHVRALNTEALGVIQDSRKVQVSLADVLEAERNKRIAAEQQTAATVAIAQEAIAVCKATTDEQKAQTIELRAMKDELEAAAVELDEARKDQKLEAGCAKIRSLAEVSPFIDRLDKLVETWRGMADGNPTDNAPADAKGWIRLLADQLENTINE